MPLAVPGAAHDEMGRAILRKLEIHDGVGPLVCCAAGGVQENDNNARKGG